MSGRNLAEIEWVVSVNRGNPAAPYRISFGYGYPGQWGCEDEPTLSEALATAVVDAAPVVEGKDPYVDAWRVLMLAAYTSIACITEPEKFHERKDITDQELSLMTSLSKWAGGRLQALANEQKARSQNRA